MVDTLAIGAPPPLGDLSAAGPVALFLDFDGTLVDIAATPGAISVPEGMARSLAALAARQEGRLALISGRSLADISDHLGPLSIARAGSHGAERLLADGSPLGPQPDAIPDVAAHAFRDMAGRVAGLEYEAKSHGAALHYRAVPQFEGELLDFAAEIAAGSGLAVKRGKCVVELVYPGSGKAGAVHAFMQEEIFSGAMPVFVGDDVTDEDGFRAANELGGFGVIVGDRKDTLARYRLPSPIGVHEWLEL